MIRANHPKYIFTTLSNLLFTLIIRLLLVLLLSTLCVPTDFLLKILVNNRLSIRY